MEDEYLEVLGSMSDPSSFMFQALNLFTLVLLGFWDSSISWLNLMEFMLQ